MKKQKGFNVLYLYCGILAVMIVVLVSILANMEKLELRDFSDNNETTKAAVEAAATEAATEEETTVDQTEYRVSVISVGDDLISDSIVHCGLEADGSYNFDELYNDTKDIISSADIAIINQETILGGPDFAYTGYPNFNSPYEIGDAARKAGFDVFLQATNHSYDMSEQGILNCIEYYKQHPEVTMIGLNENTEEQQQITVIEKNNIKIAMLNYTYGLNGYQLPAGKEYLVNLIDEEKIKADLAKAEEMADITIVFPHWGVEYTHTPTEEQVSLANMMVENGADIIIGTHPHVVMPVEWITTSNGNKGLCYYSLGNFTSSQDQVATMLGAIAKLTIVKKADKTYVEEGAGVIPIATYYVWGSGRVTRTLRLSDYTEELVRNHSINTVVSGFSLEAMQNISNEVLGDWIVE